MKKIIFLFLCFALYINLLSKNDQILDSNITSGWTKVNNYWEQQYKVEPITYIKLNSANNLIYTNSNNGTIRKWNLEDGTLIKKFSNSLVNVEINTDNENIIKIRSASNLNNFLESYNILNDSILFSTKLTLPNIESSFFLAGNTINTKFLSNKNKYICVIQNARGEYKYGTGSNSGGRIDLFNAQDGSYFKTMGTMASSGFAASSNEKEFVLSSYYAFYAHENGKAYLGESYFNNYVDSNFVSYHLLDKNGNLIPKQIFNFQFSPNGKMIYGTLGDSSLIWNTFDKKPILVLPYTYNYFAFINDSKRFLVFNKNVLQIRNLQNDLVKDSVFVKDGYVNNVICKIDSSNKFIIGGNDGILRLFDEVLLSYQLIAYFTKNKDTLYANQPIQFKDLTDKIISREWDFGDGSKSIEQNPIHIYKKSGDYTVKLVVSDGNQYDTLIKKNYVQIRVKAGFTASDVNVKGPFKIDFTNTSQGDNTFFKWYFGDGDSSNAPIPSHIYSKDGVFDVKLIVSDGKYFDTLTRKSYIKVVMPLQASFETSNNIGEAPFRVQFSNTSTGEIKGYKWSFGDGDSSTIPSPRHTYKKAGDFTVLLTVTDGINSSTYTKDKFINITAHPDIKSKYVLDTLWKITQDDFVNYKDFGSIPTISCFEYNPNDSNLVLSLFTKKDKQINYLTSINSKTGEIELNRVHSDVYSGIAFTKDSNEIIGANNLLRMYDFKTLGLKYIDNNSSNIASMNYNSKINVLTTTASDAARIYDTKKKTKINTILSVQNNSSSDQIIKCFQSNFKKYFIKGNMYVFGYASYSLRISDSNNTVLYYPSFGKFNPFRSLSMSSDNSYLAYQNIDNGIEIFDLSSLNIIDKTSNSFTSIEHVLKFSNDDSKLFIKDVSYKFYIMDILTMESQRVLENINVNTFVLDPFDKDIIYLKSQANTIYALKIRVEKSTTSIDDNEVISNNLPPFSPNPVKDKLYLKTNKFNDSELIQILDLSGRKILETEINETIDVSNLIKGIYFLKIGNKEWKFIKE